VTKENDEMREESKKVEVRAGAGATQGRRRPSGVAPAAGAVTGGLAPGQRCSAARKREVVLWMLRGESVEALSRKLGLEIYRLEKWRDKGICGIDAALKER
jgi:transposase